MSTLAPLYYKNFKCKAGTCEHSCCVGWRVELDDRTVDLYESAEGEYADELRARMCKDGDGCFIPSVGGRCPHLTEDGLCRVIIERGESYLSDICREHPRFYNFLPERTELGIGASCPEAARLILEGESSLELYELSSESEEAEGYSPLRMRERIRKILDESDGYAAAESEIQKLLALPDSILTPEFRTELFPTLEYLYPENRELIFGSADKVAASEDARLSKVLAYFIYRHLAAAENEAEAVAAVGFALFSARATEALAILTKDMAEALRIYSEEIEYSSENTEQIIFAIQSELI